MAERQLRDPQPRPRGYRGRNRSHRGRFERPRQAALEFSEKTFAKHGKTLWTPPPQTPRTRTPDHYGGLRCPGSSGVEQWIENPRVGGSIPPLGTNLYHKLQYVKGAALAARAFRSVPGITGVAFDAISLFGQPNRLDGSATASIR